MMVANIVYFLKHSKLGAEKVPHRWLDVFVVRITLECIEILVVTAESQTFLQISLSRNLDRSGEGIPSLPEEPPTTEIISIVGEIIIISSSDVNNNDVAAVGPEHHVSRNIVDIASIHQKMTVSRITDGGQQPGV